MQGLFSDIDFPLNMLVRKVALMELGGLRHQNDSGYALREVLLRLLCKGWQVRIDLELGIKDSEHAAPGARLAEAERMLVNARLITEAQDESSREPMAALRVKNGFSVSFPEHLIQEARNLLKAGKGAQPEGAER
jgi:hypothetical protein